MKKSPHHSDPKEYLDNLLINYIKGSHDVDIEKFICLAVEIEFDIYADPTPENYRIYFDHLLNGPKNQDHYGSLSTYLYECGHIDEAIDYLNKGISTLTAEDASILTYLRDELEIAKVYIGSDPHLTAQIHKAAHCGDTPILIEGPTGTGKELVARLIHDLSNRKGRFIAISCAEIATDLIESELFGHIRGAFTGALSKKIGIFKAAHNGTVFLDELNELDNHQQAKLLRFLQEKEVRALGSEEIQKVDVRVLCATNQSVSEMLKEKLLREDLYYRIGTFTIFIPPLAKRREIIPTLARYFLNRYNNTYKKSVTLTASALKILQAHSWPGNIRQLENVIGVIVGTTHDKEIKPLHLIDHIKPPSEAGLITQAVIPRWTEKELKSKYWEIILTECGGSVKKASKILGINRTTSSKRRKRKTKKKST